jgi:hypothetical protein
MRERREGGVAMLLKSSFSMPLPGSPKLYVLLSMRCTPVMNVVMTLWVYWMLQMCGSMSLLIAAVPWFRVVVRAVKQASAMVHCWENSQTTYVGASD